MNACNQTTMHEKLLELLKTRYITPLDALQHAGCLSLSQRVGSFIRDGYKVDKRWVDLPNGKRVMSYKVVAD